jgi:hippurate hydrolase
VEQRFREIVQGTAKLFETEAEIDWRPGYPVTVNEPGRTAAVVAAAARVAGESRVDAAYEQSMGAEDFSYMLEKRPGAMILIGNGDSAYLHHPAYDFDDRAIAHGVRYWLSLVGQELGGR